MYDYGARNYDPALGRWMNIDPLADEYADYSPYSYVFNDPVRHIDPDGMAPDDIVIYGVNNSSLTIKTDLIDVSVNAGGLIGDIGGNYSISGAEILGAALDIVGIFDPTGIADELNANSQASEGNWGDALISSAGIIPFAGDLAKVGKIEKDVKILDKAVDAAKGAVKAKTAQKAGNLKVAADGEKGKFESPQRGTSKKGYHLDPAHPNAKPGSGEEFPHVNWWDYTNGKRGSGGTRGAESITH